MNKKIMSLMLVLAIAVSGAFAAPLLQFGPTLFYNNQVWDSENSEIILPEGFADIKENIGLGADLRINLGMLQLAAFADCGMPFGKDLSVLTVSGGVSVNTVLSIAFLDAFVGAGAHVDSAYSFDSKEWAFNGGEFTNVGELFKSSSLFYRGGASINIGLFGVSVFADIPTSGTFGSSINLKPLFEQTKVSASLLFNIG